MRCLLSRVLFISTFVAVATFCGIVLELQEVMTFTMACKTLAISTALAIGSHTCCRALHWLETDQAGCDRAGLPPDDTWEE